MKTLSFKGLPIVLVTFVTVSCSNSVNNAVLVPPVDTLSNLNFNYETVGEQMINLNLIDLQGASVPGVKVSLYDHNPIDMANGVMVGGNAPLISAQTDANGTVNLQLNVPLELETMYVIVNSLGYVNPMGFTLNGGGTTNLTIAPAGYSNSTRSMVMSNAVANTQPANVTLVRGNIYTLSGWDSNGIPSYRTQTRDVLSQSILQTVGAAVPEYVAAPTAHPEYFANPVKANIEIIEDAQVWVTFISEGAGYRSAMGYFTYPTNSPPASISDIKERYVILPNCSFSGSGGGLVSGDKVQLVYKGENGYTDKFPAGTSVGWFLISDGFRNNAISDGNGTLYSLNGFNPGNYQQTIVLSDPANELMYISFEDITRTSSSCDQDYNDVIFYCTASPYEAINQSGVTVVVAPKDTDGDGVTDNNDAYPTDPLLAYDSYYPAKNVFGTLAYEDLWPANGDYDFNDLVVDANFHQQLNAQNKVVNVLAKLKLRAVGSSYRNGFVLGFNSSSGTVKSVTGTRVTGSVFNIASNGTEIGNTRAIVPIFTDGFTLFGNRPLTNTVLGNPAMDDVVLDLYISLTSPLSQSLLGLPPYDPFIVINQVRAREVHLMNNAPTMLADMSLLGTENDMSSVAAGRYYQGKKGRPWAIQLPVSFAYPVEKTSVSSAYPHFDDWAASKGVLYKDWYSNQAGGYRNSGAIYRK